MSIACIFKRKKVKVNNIEMSERRYNKYCRKYEKIILDGLGEEHLKVYKSVINDEDEEKLQEELGKERYNKIIEELKDFTSKIS